MKRVILFLIRRKLGLRKGECFKFANQASMSDYYLFTDTEIIKVYHSGHKIKPSNVSLNWLLNNDCKIEKVVNE